MYTLLDGLRVVEAASFIAAPSCSLHLQQFGAEVIRCDPIGGGPDYRRWPKAQNDRSFYWEGLNKGKKSIAVNLGTPAGRELLRQIVTAPGENGGLFVTNFPHDGFLAHEGLAALRPDLITARVMGWANGTTALDYTVNSAIGVPLMTGPANLGDEPVNHVLPAWDIAAGLYAAFALLAAERRRRMTGQGTEIRLPLGDVAMAFIGHLGQIGEVTASGQDRPRLGNDLYGSFGRDFATADGKRIIVIALTRPQWADLVRTLCLGEAVASLETGLGVDFSRDEGVRFTHRARLNPLVAAAIGAMTFSQVETLFAGTRVCWGPYNTLHEAIGHPGLISEANPLFHPVSHLTGETYLTPGAAATVGSDERGMPGRAPDLGEHTDEILATLLGLPDHAIGRLHDEGTVAGPDGSIS
ncbi:carnitine dehydratase [Zhengella mangrovi]|uniref:Carnitine dehydratase n=1 Tax=Zhengella mangrovi TaxID=1982044 RepID=A0A2G1QI48_9HYPH|nr:CoA transferase [Zhengella mangrovi]PHP65195.1 carnitine dehydratase [Zhengella mangrovi]